MKPFSWLGIISFFLLTIACKPAPRPSIPSPFPISTAAPVSTQTVTPTLTFTPSPSPTNTPEPPSTATESPTITPLPNLPVGLGTPLPEVKDPIKVDNVGRLKLLANYERSDPGKILIRLTQDGKLYYVASANGIDIYETQSQQLIRHFDILVRVDPYELTYSPYDLQLTSDGRRFMARLNASKVAVYNSDAAEIYSYTFPGDLDTGGAAFSPDGKELVVDICSDCNAYNGLSGFKVFDVDTASVIYDLNAGQGGDAHGWNPLFSPNGKILATQIGSQVFLWDTLKWKRITDFPTGSQYINHRISYSPDSTHVAILGDDTVTVWRLEDRKKLRSFNVCGGYWDIPQAMFSSDNAFIGILACHKIYVYKIDDGSPISDQASDFTSLTGMSLDSEGKLIVYEPKPEPGEVFAPWKSGINTNGFEFVGDQASLRLEFNSAGACSITIGGSPSCVEGRFIMGSDGQRYLVIADQINHELTLIRGKDETGEKIFSFKWTGYMITPVSLDTKHNLFFYEIWSTPNAATSYVLDMTNAKNLAQWSGWSLMDFVYSPDWSIAVFYLNHNPGKQLILFDLETRQKIFRAQGRWGGFGGLAFSPDGKFLIHYLAKPDDQRTDFFYVMDLENPSKSTRYQYPYIKDSGPTVTRYSPDGSLLVMGFFDGTLRIFDTRDESLIYEWKGHHTYITSLAFSPDMRYFASASMDGNIRIWGIWP
jgi:WD40 repeat protein